MLYKCQLDQYSPKYYRRTLYRLWGLSMHCSFCFSIFSANSSFLGLFQTQTLSLHQEWWALLLFPFSAAAYSLSQTINWDIYTDSSFVSFLSGIPAMCYLFSNAWRTTDSYILSHFPVPISSWLEVEVTVVLNLLHLDTFSNQMFYENDNILNRKQ